MRRENTKLCSRIFLNSHEKAHDFDINREENEELTPIMMSPIYSFQMPMITSMDRESVREAYEEVRNNLCDNEWAVFKFDSTEIICAAKGIGFDDFQQQFMDDERAFGYIRIAMGDEMSKRSKFLFLTWIGCDVGVMQRAKMSTDKSLMKEVISVSFN